MSLITLIYDTTSSSGARSEFEWHYTMGVLAGVGLSLKLSHSQNGAVLEEIYGILMVHPQNVLAGVANTAYSRHRAVVATHTTPTGDALNISCVWAWCRATVAAIV